MLLPPGLISWFFFDAEAIGSLELSGSPEFKRDLRKTLGFDLVDTLEYEWAPLLGQACYRPDLAGDVYGRMFAARKGITRMTRSPAR
jgi:hypothetical protein